MTKDSQHTLERFYAYSMARSGIVCGCKLVGYNAAHQLEWDTSKIIDGDAELRKEVDDAIAYLDHRGLIFRPHADNPAIVVIQPNTDERRSAVRDDVGIAA